MFDFSTEKGKIDAVIGILLHHYTRESLSEFYGISLRLINEWIGKYRSRAAGEIRNRQIHFNGRAVNRMKPLVEVYRPTSGSMYIGWKHIK
ncbi:hypothetical protein [Anaerostipes sp.]|uniref:hypothetical protein n=1 Tax=Anaerostipes sp. TaxID=1872530 RepID=UPI0025BFEEEC|nr:hypothetical protein [Anaerostipes sp.]